MECCEHSSPQGVVGIGVIGEEKEVFSNRLNSRPNVQPPHPNRNTQPFPVQLLLLHPVHCSGKPDTDRCTLHLHQYDGRKVEVGGVEVLRLRLPPNRHDVALQPAVLLQLHGRPTHSILTSHNVQTPYTYVLSVRSR